MTFQVDDRVRLMENSPYPCDGGRDATVTKADGPVMLVRLDGDSFETWAETRWWKRALDRL